tara:strand:- start:233 stop:445 length:213 start_codon:yes stop_codon:yes gene_type:complete
MKDKLEAKKQNLLESKQIVTNQINEGSKLLEKAKADLNAILGAIQVVDQLLEEEGSLAKSKEANKDGTKD